MSAFNGEDNGIKTDLKIIKMGEGDSNFPCLGFLGTEECPVTRNGIILNLTGSQWQLEELYLM